MDTITQYAPLVIALIVGMVAGGYLVYVFKTAILPADMDKVVNIAVSAITDAQIIYGNNDLSNADKASKALDIATRALKDAGYPVNAATLALIIKVVYHALKPQIVAAGESANKTIYSGPN